MLGGGSKVNVVTEDTALSLGLNWEPIAFNVRMDDNTIVVPKGIIKKVKIQIDGLDFLLCLVVLTMKFIDGSYQMLLGRP